jgi:membrane-bound lytic murein transglycosylase D
MERSGIWRTWLFSWPADWRRGVRAAVVVAVCCAWIGCASAPETQAPTVADSPPQSVAGTPTTDDMGPVVAPEEVEETSEAVTMEDSEAPESGQVEASETSQEGEGEDRAGLNGAEANHVLEQALEACDSAREFWREGSIEDAIAALDRAYSLMLFLPAEDDPLISQQKEDLRRLISRRIVEVYASRQTAVGELDRAIPLVSNPHVEREIKLFQTTERDFFMDSYRRSGRWRPMIVEELRKAGLPEQLSWLPLIESGFKVRALSRARALGMWQFISSTGYRFGLKRDWWVDERMDPVKATGAAIAYLTELHGLFGDWMTAIAGYNCGEHAVLRVINSQHVNYLDQFWDLFERLPWETARYVPRFLATLLIVSEPERYGFQLPEPDPPVEFELLEVSRSVRLAEVDKLLNLAKGTVHDLNPELRQGATPQESYQLRVPPAGAETLQASLGTIPVWSPPAQEYVVHRVRRGETLSHIARRYRTSVSTLRRYNSLRNPNRLWPGQRIKVPQRGASRAVPPPAPPPEPAGTVVAYTVRRGDNLWRLARRYATTVGAIQRDNGLASDRLRIGQVLKITVGGVATSGASYVVRRGDTLSAIADAHKVSLKALLRANGLGRRSVIYPGQRLVIP